MSDNNYSSWLDQTLPSYRRLTESVVTITENLLKSAEIDCLAVVGRTKGKNNALDKIKRKGYRKPEEQLTDLSGIRIIVYFESDIESVSNIIEDAFNVDSDNSLNQDDLMSTDQIGYRSVHFVCDLGESREKLPEFTGLAGMKFEFQVRTVLQHAWAELAHDRNYKFAGKLPKKVERQLYLYAGMLEIADKGFDEVSKQIDAYIESVDKKSHAGDLNVEVNSISLPRFVKFWCDKNNVAIDFPKNYVDELVLELNQFGVYTLDDLSKIIPERYAQILKETGYSSNILGVVRDWMLIHDWERFHNDVDYNWVVERDDSILRYFFEEDEFDELISVMGDEDEYMDWR